MYLFSLLVWFMACSGFIIILKHENNLGFVVELCFRNFTLGTLMEHQLVLNRNDSA